MMGCIKYSKQPANESYSQTQLLKSSERVFTHFEVVS